jgi:hypothetical protein
LNLDHLLTSPFIKEALFKVEHAALKHPLPDDLSGRELLINNLCVFTFDIEEAGLKKIFNLVKKPEALKEINYTKISTNEYKLEVKELNGTIRIMKLELNGFINPKIDGEDL